MSGTLLGDFVTPSRLSLNQPPLVSKPVSLTTIYTSPFAAGASSSLFGSIENMDANIPTRKGRQAAAGNMPQMRLLASKRKTLTRLMDWSSGIQQPGLWTGALANMAAKLDRATAGVWLFEIASLCDQQGETALALETHRFITNQYRKHPLAVASFQWQYQHFSSTEQAHYASQKAAEKIEVLDDSVDPLGGIQSKPVSKIVDGVRVVTWEVADPRSIEDNIDLTADSPNQDAFNRRRFQQARATGQSLSLIDPSYMDTGRNRLSAIGLNRKIDPLVPVDDQLRRFGAGQNSFLRVAAANELAMVQRNQTSEKASHAVDCLQAAKRPWLDADFSDPIWQTAIKQHSIIPLHSLHNGQSENDQVMVAADEQFLFLAIRCQLSADESYRPGSSVRKRDSDLSGADRVEIAIDVDRDNQSWFLLTVDSNGRVADSLGSNKQWNPQWFVSARIAEGYWQAEIAIPLTEISGAGDYWSISACRHLRNRVQSVCWNPQAIQQLPQAIEIESDWHLQSQHELVNLANGSEMSLPLQAFRHLRMPWTQDKVRRSQSLPETD